MEGEDVDVSVEAEADDEGGDDAQPIPTDVTGVRETSLLDLSLTIPCR